MRIAKFLWIGAAIVVLLVTLYGFDEHKDTDIGIFFAWYMLFLTFPGGVLISVTHFALYEAFSVTIEMSHLSIIMDWIGFVIIGYIQWFKLVPYVVRRLRDLQSNRRRNQ